MANAYNNSIIYNMGLTEENSLPHLLNGISPDIENEVSLIKYYNDDKFWNVLYIANSKISKLSLSSQSKMLNLIN